MTCAFNPEIACKRPSRNRKARSINKSFIYFFWRNKASAEVSSFPIAIPISNNVSKLSAKSEGVFFLWHTPISVEVVVVPQIITIHLSSTPPPPSRLPCALSSVSLRSLKWQLRLTFDRSRWELFKCASSSVSSLSRDDSPGKDRTPPVNTAVDDKFVQRKKG